MSTGFLVRAGAIALVLGGVIACGGGGDDPAATGATGAGGDGGASASSTGGSGGGCQGEGGFGEGGAPACDGPGPRFVTRVVSACFGPGQDFGRDELPQVVYGPPVGGGCCAGSTDVVALGDGGSITVAFDGNAIVDGPGPDFIVFENAFDAGGDPTQPYAELGTVEVSADGVTWVAFPCHADAHPYDGCAGWHPVYAGFDASVDPLDPAAAGGDAFDLADVGVPLARFVRITDRPGDGGVFDLDAVGIVNARCP